MLINEEKKYKFYIFDIGYLVLISSELFKKYFVFVLKIISVGGHLKINRL